MIRFGRESPVVESGYRLLRGEIGAPKQPGLCLALVRLVIEDAYKMMPYEFYRWRREIVDQNVRASQDPYARDMERSLRYAGMTVGLDYHGRYVNLDDTRIKPGDLLFRYDTAKDAHGIWVGHVGILMPGNLVLENIDPRGRLKSLSRGPTCLTPLGFWPVTTVVRFRP